MHRPKGTITRTVSALLLAAILSVAGARADEASSTTPAPTVAVEIVEDVPADTWAWSLAPLAERETYEQPAMGFAKLPTRYTDRGVIGDRSGTFLVRATAVVRLEAGEQTLLLRSLNSARLSVDGRELAVTPFTKHGGDGHEPVAPLPPEVFPGVRLPPLGHSEKVIKVIGDGRDHTFLLEAFVGGNVRRKEIGELSVSRRGVDGKFYLLTPNGEPGTPLTDEGWEGYARQHVSEITALNTQRRTTLGAEENKYWARRHEWAREWVARSPLPSIPEVSPGTPVHNEIDRFIGRKLEEAGVAPAPLSEDHAFLRRVFLDTVGVTPSPREIETFLADPPDRRRGRVIERLLGDPRWADHWVSYWQDVLAENPGILKPEMNNTGPFRWWIHESLLDNKPIDRFATELVMMEGSAHYGGPGGFALASQNDAPMAEKALIVGQAFLGVEMKCARCHDAPYHDVKQRDLFSLAAMLARGPQKVPATSSIPTQAVNRKLSVAVTLPPGEPVNPAWPFAAMLDEAAIPPGVVRNPADPRERLAAMVTSPANGRFARVIVNRLWARAMGRGLVEPVDDWEDATPSHPELLDYLARELVVGGYDLKHVTRLILNSHAYQRRVGATEPSNEKLFASPIRRRMTAEQVVDSLLAASGKGMAVEPLTFDPEARRPVTEMGNLGRPERAWQLTSLSNERDRPALSLPRAQAVADVMVAFGWRESRPAPVTCRDQAPAVQQPAILGNGLLARRAVRLSDDSALTRLCVEARDPEALADALTLRILSRPPSSAEREAVAALLRDGFEHRIVPHPTLAASPRPPLRTVAWSNHLHPDATTIKTEMERWVQRGDPPTAALDAPWRERAEDAAWALLNSPEFIFVP